MRTPDDGVSFPIAEPVLSFDNCRAPLDALTITDGNATFSAAVALSSDFAAT
jgi:hypothetical protein